MAGFFLERLLLPLFPTMAARRIGTRMQAETLLRAYDGANLGRGRKSWNASAASAATEDQPALSRLRARSRDLVRNNPWARKARRQLPAHMVGTGVVPRPTGYAPTTRKRALAAWNDWAAEADLEADMGFAAQQSLLAGTLVEGGEALMLWVPNAKAPGGWNTRILEGDFLDENYNEASRNGSGQIVSGVEFDSDGRRTAYHLWREHPGSAVPVSLFSGNRVRVEARFVDHVFERMRPGQVRGIPWLAASMLGLRDLADYNEAERWRKKIAAALAAFVTTDAGPASSSLGAVSTETDPSGGQRAIERIAPGTIKRLRPGEDVKFSSPPADQGLEPYLRWEMLAICAGIGLPYAELTGDLSMANYGSMRAGKIEFWALLDTWQEHMLAPWLNRAWRRVQAAGGVPGMTCEWGFPKRAWVDPLKDVMAEKLATRAGFSSSPDAIAARGYDWRQIAAEQAEYLALIDELGLVVEADPRKTANNGAIQAPPADDTTPPPAGG